MPDLNDLVREIQIRSQYGPDINLQDPFAAGASTGTGHWVLEHLKPEITIVPRNSAISPIVAAPWGTPGPTRWPWVRGALITCSLVGLGLGVRALMR